MAYSPRTCECLVEERALGTQDVLVNIPYASAAVYLGVCEKTRLKQAVYIKCQFGRA